MNHLNIQQQLVIKDAHVQEWLDSKIDPEIIKLNLKSLSGTNAYEYLLYGLEDKESRRNDRRLNASYMTRYKHLDQGGWWCAGIDLLNDFKESQWGCFKPDKPRKDWQSGKPQKYEHPAKVPTELIALKVPSHIWEKIAEFWQVEREGDNFWQWVINNKNKIPLVITEGVKKAAALLTLGFPAIALPGIYSGAKNQKDPDGEEILDTKGNPVPKLIPQLEIFTEGKGKREIIFSFDCDQKRKTGTEVEKQLVKLGQLFETAKCLVTVVEWKASLGKGIDDLIVNQGEDFIYSMFDARKPLNEFKFDRKQRTKRLNDLEVANFIHDKFFVDDRISFNEMSGKICLDGKEWKLPDALNIHFHEEHDISASRDHLADALLYYAKKKTFNPVKLYLEKVHKDANRISIDDLATRYFGSTNPLDNIKVKKALISMVARAIRPGCKVHTMLVLVGEQGVGKSAFFETLAGEEFFGDSVEDVKGKETYLLLNTAWIQELGELGKITTNKETEDVKAFLSRRGDTYRELYERRPTEHPRHCVFVGSVNNVQFLKDETGARRFWVVKVNVDSIDYELMAKERDGIWAAAVDAFLSGEEWHLLPKEFKQNNLDNALFQQHDEWEDLIDNYSEFKEFVSVAEILSEVLDFEIKDFPKGQVKVGKLLQKLGWGKIGPRMHQGKKQVVWAKKSQSSIVGEKTESQVSVTIVDTIDDTIVDVKTSESKPFEPSSIASIVDPEKAITTINAMKLEEITPPITDGLDGEWVDYSRQSLNIGDIVEVKELGIGRVTKYYSKSNSFQFDYSNKNTAAVSRRDILKIFKIKFTATNGNGKH